MIVTNFGCIFEYGYLYFFTFFCFREQLMHTRIYAKKIFIIYDNMLDNIINDQHQDIPILKY
jgi:hypothetical protein